MPLLWPACGLGGWASTEPPEIIIPVWLVTFAGLYMLSQCFQIGRFTSAALRHCCEGSSTA
jgi:hypothetical protein